MNQPAEETLKTVTVCGAIGDEIFQFEHENVMQVQWHDGRVTLVGSGYQLIASYWSENAKIVSSR